MLLSGAYLHAWNHFARTARSTIHIRALFLKASMARAVHDSDSDHSSATISPRKSKPQAASPERESDHSGPEESDEEDGEVYEIEAILDAKRGATGSVRSLKHSLRDARLTISSKASIGYLVKWKGYPDEENSWVDEGDAV